MARADTLTKLPLDRWAGLVGVNPLHFNGVSTTALPHTSCALAWPQHSWQQAGAISREDVAQFIAQAESDLERYLGFRLLPTWEVAEVQPTIAPGITEVFSYAGFNARGFRQGIRADWGHFITGGVSAKSLLSANAPVTYEDQDSDGYSETAWVQVTTTVTDEEELAVYFPFHSGNDAWEVRPLREVTFANGIATIKMWRHQLVNPDLWEALGAGSIDGDDDDNFLSVLDVYRHYNDPQTQASLIWQPWGTEQSALSNQTGFLSPVNERLGVVRPIPGTWNATDEDFDLTSLTVCRQPDQVQMHYRAGYRDLQLATPNRTMALMLERAVVYYSLALMDREICGCSNLNSIVKLHTEDLAMVWSNPTASAQFKLSDSDTFNPLGTRRGAINAWHLVNQPGLALGRAVQV